MEKPPLGGSLEGLTDEERVVHYRNLAEEALRKASQARPKRPIPPACQGVGWHGLAAEAQKNVDRPPPVIGKLDARQAADTAS